MFVLVLVWSGLCPSPDSTPGSLVLKSFRIISMHNFASVLPRPCSPTLLVQVTRTRSPGCVRRGCLGAALELKTAPGSISISFIPFPFPRKNLCTQRIPSLSRLCPSIGKNQKRLTPAPHRAQTARPGEQEHCFSGVVSDCESTALTMQSLTAASCVCVSELLLLPLHTSGLCLSSSVTSDGLPAKSRPDMAHIHISCPLARSGASDIATHSKTQLLPSRAASVSVQRYDCGEFPASDHV